MATLALNRRANSLPAHTVDLLVDSQLDLDSLQPQNEGRLATSPSFFEPRSPTANATFSPVFELELGGTPQDQQNSRPQHLRRAAVPFRQLLPGQPLAALRQLPHVSRAVTGAAAGAALDRSQSDLQVMLAQHQGAKALVQHAVEVLTPAAERLLELSKPNNELELELSRRLRAFRNARISKQQHSSTSPSPAPDSGPSSGGADHHAAAALAAPQGGAASPSGPTPGEIEVLASELQSAGFIVQILDGTRLSKDTRSCLRTLKHRFLVCTGWAGPSQRTAQQPYPPQVPQQQPQQPQQQQQSQPYPQRLTAPLVVEVRFREQFLIANPSRAYENLLLALPLVFVGSLQSLDAVVELTAAEVAAVFKQAGRPLPPWRTKGAMLSKWAPSQLIDLERVMRQAAAHQVTQQQQQQQEEEEALRELQRQDLDSDCHKSWGSGIGETSPRVEFVVPHPFQSAATDVGDVERNPSQPSGAAPAAAAAAAAATVAGLGGALAAFVNPGNGATAAEHRSSAPLRSLRSNPPAAGAAAGTASPFYVYINGPEQLLYDDRPSLHNVGLPDAVEVGVGPSAPPEVEIVGELLHGGLTLPVGLTFPVLPEVSVRVPGAPQRLLAPFVAVRQGPPPHLSSSPVEEEPSVHQLLQQPRQLRDQEQGPRGQGSREALGQVPSLPPPPRSAFSPFACVSMPNVLDPEEGSGAPDSEEDVTPPKVQSDTMPRAPAVAITGSLIGVGSGSLPEFTLRHAALAAGTRPPPQQMTIAAAAAVAQPQPPMYGIAIGQGVCDLASECDAGMGAMWPNPTRPMPTPPRAAAPLYASAFHAGLPQAAAAAGAPVGHADMELILAHQPLASATLGLNAAMAAGVGPGAPSTAALPPGAAAAVPTAASALTTVQTHPGGGSGAGGGAFMLPFAWGDSLRITRRSSSDLSRTANKFKNAKSLLAAALRLATGAGPGKDGSGGSAPPSPSAAPGVVVGTGPGGASAQVCAPLGGPQQELRDGLVRDNRDRSGGGGGGGGRRQPPGTAAAAGSPEVLGAGAAARAGPHGHGYVHGHGHEVTQVELAGGVITLPSADEPPWARIATVRWGAPAAGAGAAAAAAAAADPAGRAL